eukprot:1155130-Rhodomonas_salina.1
MYRAEAAIFGVQCCHFGMQCCDFGGTMLPFMEAALTRMGARAEHWADLDPDEVSHLGATRSGILYAIMCYA